MGFQKQSAGLNDSDAGGCLLLTYELVYVSTMRGVMKKINS